MLKAVKLAVGGIMKFDPIKLNLDGKLFNFGEMDRKLDEKFRNRKNTIKARLVTLT